MGTTTQTPEVDMESAPTSPFTDDDEEEIVIVDDDNTDLVLDDETDPDQEPADKKGKPEEEEEETITIPKKDYEAIKLANKESTQEGQKLHWVDKVRVDPYEYIKLYESDQPMAKKVLEHTGVDQDPRELYNQLRKEKYGENDPIVQKEEILRVVEEKEIKREFNKIIKSSWIDLESKSGKSFQEEYDFLTDNGKRVTSENVDSFVSKAMKLSWFKPISQQKAKTDKELIGAGSSGKASWSAAPAAKGSFFDKFDKGWPANWY